MPRSRDVVDEWFQPGAGVVYEMGHAKPQPFGPTQVESDIRRLCDLLGNVTDDLATASHNAAVKDAAYKRAYASALLMAQGKTVGDREAVADLECADEYLARKIADAMLLTVQESGRNIRAQLDALRSINANLRQLT